LHENNQKLKKTIVTYCYLWIGCYTSKPYDLIQSSLSRTRLVKFFQSQPHWMLWKNLHVAKKVTSTLLRKKKKKLMNAQGNIFEIFYLFDQKNIYKKIFA